MNAITYNLDLDGVLADYDAGMRAKGYNVDPALGRELNRSGTKNPLKLEMYKSIQGTRFYQDLPLMPGAKLLWAYVMLSRPIILTAAPKFGGTEEDYYLNPYWLGAAYHKRRWVEKMFFTGHTMPDEDFICTTSAQKFKYLNRRHTPKQILVDDRLKNCEDWAKAGGFAVLHDGNVELTIEHLKRYEAGPAHAGIAGAN